jgi:hypothetical protein
MHKHYVTYDIVGAEQTGADLISPLNKEYYLGTRFELAGFPSVSKYIACRQIFIARVFPDIKR